MLIFVDIDETICYTGGSSHEARDYSLAVPIYDNIEAVNKYYDEGHEIVYWTARGFQTGIDWFEITNNQLIEWGAKYHRLVMDKPAYDLFIDDKTINVRDWEENGRCIPEA